MNMVERVARAIAADEGTYGADEMIDLVAGATVEGYTDIVPFWVLFSSKARAAIEAMREPTTEMIGAGGATAFGGTDDNDMAALAEGIAHDAYTAMIDAALSPRQVDTEGGDK